MSWMEDETQKLALYVIGMTRTVSEKIIVKDDSSMKRDRRDIVSLIQSRSPRFLRISLSVPMSSWLVITSLHSRAINVVRVILADIAFFALR